MKNIRKEEIRQEVYDLYDDYAHNRIDRRQFMERLSLYAVGGMTVSSLMSFMMPNYQDNIQVKADDPRLKSEKVEYKSPQGGGRIKGLLSRPVNNTSRLPGIVVVHENRGLNPHIEDVSRRAALEGFLVLAPDALSPLGGYPGNDDDGRALQSKRDRDEMLEDFIAAFNYLEKHPECNGRIGVVGFCFGGWIANMMAVRIPDLRAAVPFYGGQPDPEDAAAINAALLLHFAEHDERVNAGWPEYEKALKQYNITFDAYMYPGVNHGFHNDTTPRFDEGAAKLAWQRTIDFFKERLS